MAPASAPSAHAFRQSILSAARFWEGRRLPYNAILAAVVAIWVFGTWPHFRPAFNLTSLGFLVLLAAVANVCYCTAHLVDVPMLQSPFASRWLRWRWRLWVVGTLFAVLIECYWIADEIYPYV